MFTKLHIIQKKSDILFKVNQMIPLYYLFHIRSYLPMQQTKPNNCVVNGTHKHQLAMEPKITNILISYSEHYLRSKYKDLKLTHG